MKFIMFLVVSGQMQHMISGVMDKIGIISMLAIVGINVAEENGVIQLASDLASEWGAFDWLSIIAGVGTTAFAIKCILEIRLAYLKIKLAKKSISDEV